jgi:hypothetical protein
MGKHQDLDTTDHHKPGYVQSSDPGAIGAGKMWIDTSGGSGAWEMKIRNTSNSGWEAPIGGSPGFFDAIFAAKGSFSAGSAGGSDYIDWGTEIKKDTGFTHSTSVSPEEITLDDAGWYLIIAQFGGHRDGAETEGDMSIDCVMEYYDSSWNNTYQETKIDLPAGCDEGVCPSVHLYQTTGSNWRIRFEVQNDGDASQSFDGLTDYNRITIVRLT